MGKNTHGKKHRVRQEEAAASAASEAAAASAAARAAALAASLAAGEEEEDLGVDAEALAGAAREALTPADAASIDAAREERRLCKKDKRRQRLAAEASEREAAMKEGKEPPVSAKEARREERRRAEAARVAARDALRDAKAAALASAPAPAPEEQEEATQADAHPLPPCAAAEAAAESPSWRIFVGGLPFSYSASRVASLFSLHGGVSAVERLTFPDSGKFRGLAFVTLADEGSFHACLALNGLELEEGFTLSVKRAKARAALEALAESGVTGDGVQTQAGPPRSKRAKLDPAALPLDAASRTVYVGNLSYDIDEEALAAAFPGLQVESVAWGLDKATDDFKGYAHVCFATQAHAADAAARNGEELLGRPMRVAPEVKRIKPRQADGQPPAEAAAAAPLAGARREGAIRAYVTGLPYHADAEAVVAALKAAFGQCGARGVVACKLGRDAQAGAAGAVGAFRGYAHLDFESSAALDQAVLLSGAQVLQRSVKVSVAQEKPGKGPPAKRARPKGAAAVNS